MFKIFIWTLISFAFASCSLLITKKSYLIKTFPNPPGTIKIESNLYIDKTEVPNYSYSKYVRWIFEVYGDTSIEFQNIRFTKNHWLEYDETFKIYDSLYHYHPSYRWYPAVGITYKQAKIYSEWKSDRIFEFYLIYNKTIKENNTRNKDSIFSIEKYFSGNYNGLKPNFEIQYPKFSLPSRENYLKAYQISDSVNTKNYKKCRGKFCNEDMLIECHSIETRNLYNIDPPKPTKCFFCKKDIISHLKGNVREYTKLNLIYGASFVDSAKFENTFRVLPDNVNSYTGFRNVCSYQKWIKQ